MRILVIGTGTIGRAVVAALSAGNEIISASLRSTTLKVDITEPVSIQTQTTASSFPSERYI